jgi:lipopolysaccharide transport system permease protein
MTSQQQLTEVWDYRELLYFLAWREIKIRYKQAALGALWAVIQPLFTMVIFTLFFGRLAGMKPDGIPYPIFAYCALVPWIYFSGVLGQAGNSLIANSNLITKVYFPRVLLPTASALAALLDFIVSSSLLFLLMAYYGVWPTWRVVYIPLLTLVMVMLTLGVSMFLAALNVRFRDIKYTLPFLIQLWLFITPIVYPPTIVPARFRVLLALNPCFGLVEGFRASLIPGATADPRLLMISIGVTCGLFGFGAVYFRKTEESFADIV